ncbi:MAG: protease inhibitor I42 family protein [Clostridiales bacterium]|nr:protease inhibitor I42 family protein [Clostridiales bacterium]
MKKILSILLVLILSLGCTAALAETAPADDNAAEAADAPWYEMGDDGYSVRVTLPGDTEGYKWVSEISVPEMMKVKSESTAEDGAYTAAYTATMEQAGTVSLIFRYVNDSDEALKTRVLELFVNESGELFVESALNQDPSADWYEIEPDAGVLTVRLSANANTGYEWTFTSTDESAVELITSEYIADEAAADQVGVGGTYVASFRGLKQTADTVELTFSYGRSWEEKPIEMRTLTLSVDQDNKLSVERVDLFDIIAPIE